MKRTLLTMMASSMLVFALPAVASASHGKHHHGARHSSSHRHHAKGARLLTFAPATPASGAPTTTAAPTTPANETAGTVTSFTNGVLTITLTDGTVVSGKVTEETELHCRSAIPPSSNEGDDQGGGDDQNGRESGEHGGPSAMGMEHRDFQGNDGGDGQGDHQGGNDEGCTTAALVPGAIVREAELSLSGAGAVWEKVDLVK
jgi:hypothetical protein